MYRSSSEAERNANSSAQNGSNSKDSAEARPRELKRSVSSYQRAKESVLATYDVLVNMNPWKKNLIKVAGFFAFSSFAILKYGHKADLTLMSADDLNVVEGMVMTDTGA